MPFSNLKTKPFFQTITAVCFLFAIAVAMLILSWNKWADPLTDYSRELYIPWQLSQGKILYRDLFLQFGPFSKYLNGGLFFVFGAYAHVLIYFQILLVFLFCSLIFTFFKKTSDLLTATATAACFLFLFAFSQYYLQGNFNFVCPYSAELVHGLIWAILGIMLSCFATKLPYVKRSFLVGIMGGLVFLCKAEVFLAFFGAQLILLALSMGQRPFWKPFLSFIGGVFSALCIATLWLGASIGLLEGAHAIIMPYRYIVEGLFLDSFFYKKVSGTFDLRQNLFQIVLCFCLWGSFLSWLFLISRKKPMRLTHLILVALLFVSWLDREHIMTHVIRYGIQALPVFLGIQILWFFVRLRNVSDAEEKTRLSFLLLWNLFSFLLLFKIMFAAQVGHYGFALALPGTLACIQMGLYEIPNRLLGVQHNVTVWRKYFLIIISLFTAVHLGYCLFIYSHKNYAVRAGNHVFMAYSALPEERGMPDGPKIQSAITALENNLSSDATLALWPQGAALNFFLRKTNPTPYVVLMPPELKMISGQKMLTAYQNAPPDWILLAPYSFEEYGVANFSSTQNDSIFMQWLKTTYQKVDSEDNGESLSFQLYQRR